MRKSYGIVLALGVCAVVALLSCDQDQTPFSPQSADVFKSTVSGRVTKQNGDALKGALVTALPGGATTVTADSGKFELSLGAGSYRLSISKDDYRDTSWKDSVKVGLLAKASLDAVKAQYRYATIKGVILDSNGATYPGAGVAVEDQSISATTYSAGSFTLGRVEPGKVRLFAVISGQGYTTLDTILKASDTLKGVYMKIARKGGTVTGTVQNNGGTGVSGATVSAAGGALTATTASDGSFSLKTVPSSGSVALTVTTPSGDTQTVTGVTALEGGTSAIGSVSVASTSADSVVVRSGLALGTTESDSVTLQATTNAVDSSVHILRWAWSSTSGRSWDTTSVASYRLHVHGWSVGEHPVLVKALLLDTATKSLRSTSAGTISVRLSDVTAPVLVRVSPTSDTTGYAWADSTVTVKWAVSDDSRLDSVWLDGVAVAPSAGFVSRAESLPVGTTRVRLAARDSSGNVSRDSVVLVRAAGASVVGAWSAVLRDTGSTYLDVDDISLNFDGSGAYTSVDRYWEVSLSSAAVYRDTSTSRGTWRTSGDSLFMTDDSGTYGYKYSINGASLTVSGVEDSGRAFTDVFTSAAAADTTPSPAASVSDSSTGLSSLSVGAGTLTPGFSAATTSYVDTVGTSVTSLSVAAKAVSDSTVLVFNGSLSSVVAVPRDTVVKVVVANHLTAKTRTYSIGVVHRSSTTTGGTTTTTTDTIAPVVTRSSPRVDTTTNAWSDSTATVSWKVTDANLDTVRIGGVQVTPNGLGFASRTLTLAAGTTKVSLVAKDFAGNTTRDSVVFVRAAGVVVRSTQATGRTFTAPYRVHFYADSSVDTTGLTIHLTRDSTATTSSSTALANWFGFGLASPTQIHAGPWRNGARIGPDQIFNYKMDSCVYTFDQPDSDAVYADDTSLCKRTGQYIYGWSSVTSAGTWSNPTSDIASGKEIKTVYTVDGDSSYPSVGLGLFLPYSPLSKAIKQDFSRLSSVTAMVRDTRAATNTGLKSFVRVNFGVSPDVDKTTAASLSKGIAYGWDVTLTSGKATKITLAIGDAAIPDWASSPSPTTLTEQLAELQSLEFAENCANSTCSKQTGTLEIDNLTYHFK
jgi:hypothetical protein